MPIWVVLGHAIAIQETKNRVKTIISGVQILLTGAQPGCCQDEGEEEEFGLNVKICFFQKMIYLTGVARNRYNYAYHKRWSWGKAPSCWAIFITVY